MLMYVNESTTLNKPLQSDTSTDSFLASIREVSKSSIGVTSVLESKTSLCVLSKVRKFDNRRPLLPPSSNAADIT